MRMFLQKYVNDDAGDNVDVEKGFSEQFMPVKTAGNVAGGFVDYCNMSKIHRIIYACEYCGK